MVKGASRAASLRGAEGAWQRWIPGSQSGEPDLADLAWGLGARVRPPAEPGAGGSGSTPGASQVALGAAAEGEPGGDLADSDVTPCSQSSALLMRRQIWGACREGRPCPAAYIRLPCLRTTPAPSAAWSDLSGEVTKGDGLSGACGSDLQARGGEGAAPLLILGDNCHFCCLQAKPFSKVNRWTRVLKDT